MKINPIKKSILFLITIIKHKRQEYLILDFKCFKLVFLITTARIYSKHIELGSTILQTMPINGNYLVFRVINTKVYRKKS